VSWHTYQFVGDINPIIVIFSLDYVGFGLADKRFVPRQQEMALDSDKIRR
jgi:hypothetical protein